MERCRAFQGVHGCDALVVQVADLESNGDVMLAVMHKREWGGKLATACARHVLGADAPEEMDFAEMSQKATADVSPNHHATVTKAAGNSVRSVSSRRPQRAAALASSSRIDSSIAYAK